MSRPACSCVPSSRARRCGSWCPGPTNWVENNFITTGFVVTVFFYLSFFFLGCSPASWARSPGTPSRGAIAAMLGGGTGRSRRTLCVSAVGLRCRWGPAGWPGPRARPHHGGHNHRSNNTINNNFDHKRLGRVVVLLAPQPSQRSLQEFPRSIAWLWVPFWPSLLPSREVQRGPGGRFCSSPQPCSPPGWSHRQRRKCLISPRRLIVRPSSPSRTLSGDRGTWTVADPSCGCRWRKWSRTMSSVGRSSPRPRLMSRPSCWSWSRPAQGTMPPPTPRPLRMRRRRPRRRRRPWIWTRRPSTRFFRSQVRRRQLPRADPHHQPRCPGR